MGTGVGIGRENSARRRRAAVGQLSHFLVSLSSGGTTGGILDFRCGHVLAREMIS